MIKYWKGDISNRAAAIIIAGFFLLGILFYRSQESSVIILKNEPFAPTIELETADTIGNFLETDAPLVIVDAPKPRPLSNILLPEVKKKEEPIKQPNEPTHLPEEFNCDTELKHSGFYMDSQSQAVRVEKELREQGNTTDADLLQTISCRPHAIWIIGDNLSEVHSKVNRVLVEAEKAKKIPVLVLYNIPDHTTLTYWSGVNGLAGYQEWVNTIVDVIGNRTAWIIIEPDSIGLLPNLKADDQEVRIAQLRYAIDQLNNKTPNTRIYIDAGHADWRKSGDVAKLLLRAGIENADGFSTNVSNYQYLENEITYAKELSKLVGGKHFVIDTSRNGIGPPSSGFDWCNASSVAIGDRPTQNTGVALLDALLWIKPPGESDGQCAGGPPAGKFWLERALDMIRNQR